jgi:hypothetical protein
MRISVDLPVIAACNARRCAFNRDAVCHAQAITVGNTVAPSCDTFLDSITHNHRESKGGVGACKSTHCRYNDDLACSAESVRIGEHQDNVTCDTFARR